MLLGIVLHSAVPFIAAPIPWPVHDSNQSLGMLMLVGAIHGFRMQLFFFLAGFFGHLLWQALGTRQFLRQRFTRIGVPFLVGMLTIVPLILVIWWWADSITGSSFMRRQMSNVSILRYPTAHLWFLEVLLLLYLASTALAWCAKYVDGTVYLHRMESAFDWLMRQSLKPLLLAVPTVALLWGGPMLGEVDQPGMRLLPAARALGYYGLFFAVGWWLQGQRHLLDVLRRGLAPYFVLALISFLILGACLGVRINRNDPSFTALKLVALVAASLYAWFMTFAMTGLFLRVAAQRREWVRYLADASYWCYLCHVPLVMVLQIAVWSWPANAWLKFGLVLSITMAVLLASYHGLVRYTWVGRLLNGQRRMTLSG